KSGSGATFGCGGAAADTDAFGASCGLSPVAGAADSSAFCFCAGASLLAPLFADVGAEALSPSAIMVAIGVFTATSAVPSGTRILPRVPSSTASTSIVALSVSISAITSPADTLSPSFFSHLARLPSSMVGDSAGIRISTGITRLRKGSRVRSGGEKDRRDRHHEDQAKENEEGALEGTQRRLHLRTVTDDGFLDVPRPAREEQAQALAGPHHLDDLNDAPDR